MQNICLLMHARLNFPCAKLPMPSLISSLATRSRYNIIKLLCKTDMICVILIYNVKGLCRWYSLSCTTTFEINCFYSVHMNKWLCLLELLAYVRVHGAGERADKTRSHRIFAAVWPYMDFYYQKQLRSGDPPPSCSKRYNYAKQGCSLYTPLNHHLFILALNWLGLQISGLKLAYVDFSKKFSKQGELIRWGNFSAIRNLI